jgi:hypothetical protein
VTTSVGDTMKALTIHQPYAHWIMTCEKAEETRSWSTKHRGPLWIHVASRGKSLPTLRDCEPDRWQELVHSLPFGAIVGVVELMDCHPAVNSQPGEDVVYVWELRNPRPLPSPLPCKGQLGVWNVPVIIEEQLPKPTELAPAVKQRKFGPEAEADRVRRQTRIIWILTVAGCAAVAALLLWAS